MLSVCARLQRLRVNGTTFVKLFTASAIALVILTWGIAQPSFWGDEVATISGATRSLPALFAMMQHVDAVHGVYYLFMHFWVWLFGIGEFSLRFPSALAVVLTGAVVWTITKPKFGERVAWWAYGLALLLPRLSWAATEARSYGFTALLGALLVWALLKAIESKTENRTRIFWVAYTFLLVVALQVFLYQALFAAAHGVWLLLKYRRQFSSWLMSVLISLLVDGYLIYWDILEKNQINWIHALVGQEWQLIGVDQYFEHSPALAILFLGLMALLGLHASLGKQPVTQTQQNFTLLAVTTVALPTLLVAGASLLVKNSIYDPRYFTFAAPMVAILFALGLDRAVAIITDRQAKGDLKRQMLHWSAYLLVIALTVQPFLLFRGPTAKGTNWRTIASTLSQIHHSKILTGELATTGHKAAVVFADLGAKSPSVSRIRIAYPWSMSGLSDPTLDLSHSKTNGLYDRELSLRRSWPAIAKSPLIVLIGAKELMTQATAISKLLLDHGYRIRNTVHLGANWVSVFSIIRNKEHRWP